MIRQLIEYLPPIIRNVREYRAILESGAQAEISDLWDAVDSAFDNQFVETATLYGVERWEKMLKISPKASHSLADRKFTILARMNEQLPYTLPVLKNMLQSLCGKDGFVAEMQSELYTLRVSVALVAKANFDDVKILLHRIVPANMVIELTLMYNTFEKMKNVTWGYLQNKTWEDAKESELI